MGQTTGISWADSTWNPVIGCTKVSPGCDHCYAEAYADRFGVTTWGPSGERKRTSEAYWRKPLAWNAQAAAAGVRRRVFCASLADVFDSRWPDGVREDLWELIRKTPMLDWQLLTKRPQAILRMLPDDWGEENGYPNVWLGISTEDQEHYDLRWPLLSAVPAEIRFVSYEPSLGPLRLEIEPRVLQCWPDWCIAGGETGPGRRPYDPDWFRALRDECRAYGVPFFCKQLSGRTPAIAGAAVPDDLRIKEFPR